MKNVKLLLTTTLLGIAGLGFAQIDDNMVPNPYFEEINGKLKKAGEIILAEPWYSPTEAQADLFEADHKRPELNIPLNEHGKETPLEGDHYAGLVFYSYKNKAPRTYLSVEMFSEMKEGGKYCVSFNVSLSDLSKYAVNNVGAHLSKKKVDANGEGHLLLGTTVSHSKNVIIEDMAYWTRICQVYTAEGGEKFITIGNFETDEDTEWKKMKKDKEFVSSQQTYDAYYYVEGIEVYLLDDDNMETCQCEENLFDESATVIFSEHHTHEWGDLSLGDKLKYSTIYFAENKYMIETQFRPELDSLAALMVAHPDFNLEVTGHSTSTEVKKEKMDGFGVMLAENRANKVVDELVALGIDRSRFTIVVSNDENPASTADNDVGDAKNRRVSFKILD